MDDNNLHKEPADISMFIGYEPVMQSAVDVMEQFGTRDKIILKSKGNAIPNAVAVANIITEKMLTNTKIHKITLDTESEAGIGKMTSTIEIILNKNLVDTTGSF